ncbi:hypothetical protein PENSPDRAFT_673908 [Peniophora sp. CONT]|nr:hypothetical protein PENSPDRAFT_673908 [Peniophora sp. CONT]
MPTIDVGLATRFLFTTQVHFCCMYAVFCWDWLTGIVAEYYFIWKTKWTPVKALYIFTRYWVLCTVPYVLWCYTVDHDQDTCNKIFRSPVALALWNQVGSEAILLVRTYAFFGRNIYVLGVCMSMLGSVIAYQIWALTKKMLPLPFLNGVSGPCLPMAIPGQAHLLGFFVAPLCFDTAITVATLWKAFILRKNGPSSHIIQVFLKNGLFYFLLISAANLHAEMSAIMIPLSIILSPLLACRLIIDIRQRAASPSGGYVSSEKGPTLPMRVPRPFPNPNSSGFELQSRQTTDLQGVEAGEQDDPDYKGDAGVTGTYHSVRLPASSSMSGIRVDVAHSVEYR